MTCQYEKYVRCVENDEYYGKKIIQSEIERNLQWQLRTSLPLCRRSYKVIFFIYFKKEKEKEKYTTVKY